MSVVQPILIIRKGRQDFYPSICEASKCLGISRKRIYRALLSEDGLIMNTKPPLFVDTPSWEVTQDDIRAYYFEKEEQGLMP